MTEREQEREIVWAVLYAMRLGLFFPVREPRANATVTQLKRWGAMHYLHKQVAKLRKDWTR